MWLSYADQWPSEQRVSFPKEGIWPPDWNIGICLSLQFWGLQWYLRGVYLRGFFIWETSLQTWKGRLHMVRLIGPGPSSKAAGSQILSFCNRLSFCGTELIAHKRIWVLVLNSPGVCLWADPKHSGSFHPLRSLDYVGVPIHFSVEHQPFYLLSLCGTYIL